MICMYVMHYSALSCENAGRGTKLHACGVYGSGVSTSTASGEEGSRWGAGGEDRLTVELGRLEGSGWILCAWIEFLEVHWCACVGRVAEGV